MRVIGETHAVLPTRSFTGASGVSVIIKREIGFRRQSSVSLRLLETLTVDGECVTAEPDRWACHKAATDILIHGTVFSPKPVAHLDAHARVGVSQASVRVHGERRIRVRGDKLQYEQVSPLREERLSYAQAYGGAIGGTPPAHKRRGKFGASQRYEPDPSYWSYPRNPAGRGFALQDNKQSLDDSLAPSQEDPSDPASTDRLLRRAPLDWQTAPIPGGMGPIALAWFPRAHWLVPFGEELRGQPLPELAAHALDAHDIERRFGTIDARALQCARPNLVTKGLAGNVPISLQGFRWGAGEARFSVDVTPPKARLSFTNAGSFDVMPSLKTLTIDADEETVTLLWVGFQPTAIPYRNDQLNDIRVDLHV